MSPKVFCVEMVPKHAADYSTQTQAWVRIRRSGVNLERETGLSAPSTKHEVEFTYRLEG